MSENDGRGSQYTNALRKNERDMDLFCYIYACYNISVEH